MSTVAFQCGCCGEESTGLSCQDHIFGSICTDCAEGINSGREVFRKLNVSGIYFGACPDNGEGGFQ